ncbi:MAG: NusG domain II-containing protein [Clostridia bacterium]|nr:NusG domain II-containing protein [Clostridia bacterium]
MRLKFQKGDWIAVGLVIVLAVCVFLPFLPSSAAQPGAVEIWQNGVLLDTFPLDRDGEYIIDASFRNVITVRDGQAAITESTCPGADCVHSGWIRHTGRSIVCLPNRTEVRIVGTDGDVDFVVG